MGIDTGCKTNKYNIQQPLCLVGKLSLVSSWLPFLELLCFLSGFSALPPETTSSCGPPLSSLAFPTTATVDTWQQLRFNNNTHTHTTSISQLLGTTHLQY